MFKHCDLISFIIILQFQSVFFFVTEGGRVHLILSAIALTPSLHFVRSAASSIFNSTFSTLSTICLHIIFVRPRFHCPFTFSIIAFFSIIITFSNHMSIPSYSISSSIFFLSTNFTPHIALSVLLKITFHSQHDVADLTLLR